MLVPASHWNSICFLARVFSASFTWLVRKPNLILLINSLQFPLFGGFLGLFSSLLTFFIKKPLVHIWYVFFFYSLLVIFIKEYEWLEWNCCSPLISHLLDKLTQVLEAERESPREFQPLPFHYIEISKLLFNQYVITLCFLFPIII